MIKSTWRGYEIKEVDGVWVYSDTNKSVRSRKNRACGYCGESQTKKGHDACIGTLKGVMNACCGHGKDNEAYIQFSDGRRIKGSDALIIFNELKNE